MTVTPPAITGAILAAGNAIFPGSQMLPKIATAMGNSVLAWLPLPTNVGATGVTSGVAGAGTVNGKMFFVPASFYPAALAAAGYTGTDAPRLGAAVEIGMGIALNGGAQYTGVSAGVSSGADVSKVARSIAAPLVGILMGNLAAVAITGTTAAQLATGLANGTGFLVLTGYGVGGVLPVAPAPAAAVGTSQSIVF